MKIQIICSSPGMRRNGKQHPASAFYDEGQWSEEQLEAFRADPAFVVREVDDAAENTMTDTDFQLKVNAEVDRLVGLKAEELQKGFDKAVQDALADKVADLKAKHDNALDELGKRVEAASESLATASKTLEERDTALLAANDKISDLEKQLADAAKKPAAKK